jgi:tetratricopeptide (TPR) repeat protein
VVFWSPVTKTPDSFKRTLALRIWLWSAFAEELSLAWLLDKATLRSGALVGLGSITRQQGDFATARQHFAEALTIHRELREEWMIGEALDLLGEPLQQQGVWEEARHHYREELTVAHAVGDKAGMALILYHLSTLAPAQCQPMPANAGGASGGRCHGVVKGKRWYPLSWPHHAGR